MQKRILALLLAMIFTASCFCSCSNTNTNEETTTAVTTTAKQTDDTSFKLSYTQSDSLDPFEAETQNNQVLSSLVFESLFDLDEQYEISPNIATGYEYLTDKKIQIDIDTSITFSDGSSLTIDDVEYSVNSAMSSPAYKNSLECVSYVQTSGDSLIVYLEYANEYAINLFTFPICKEDIDGDFPVGSGRYAYANEDDAIVLKAVVSDDFDPYITTINLVNVTAADSIDNAVNIGNISYAFRDLSSSLTKRMSCAKKLVNMNNLVYIGVNGKSGITSNEHIRRAISLAVDRSVIAQSAYAGYAQEATSLFNPNFSLSQGSQIFSETSDASSAKQEISQSGYEDEDLSITILVNKNSCRTAAAKLIKTQLEAVGFTVKIKTKETKAYKSAIKDVDFDIYIGEVKLSDDMSLMPFLSSDGGTHYGIKLKKLTCDDLYEDYLNGDEDLGKFVLAFNTEMPYIPILYKQGMICYSKAMNGDMQGYYGNFFSNIETWNFLS